MGPQSGAIDLGVRLNNLKSSGLQRFTDAFWSSNRKTRSYSVPPQGRRWLLVWNQRNAWIVWRFRESAPLADMAAVNSFKLLYLKTTLVKWRLSRTIHTFQQNVHTRRHVRRVDTAFEYTNANRPHGGLEICVRWPAARDGAVLSRDSSRAQVT
jgi:hypothetical protein